MNIGERLIELRKAKNLSQEKIAKELSVTRQTVSKWETNQTTPDFDKIIPLCELLEITADELLAGHKKEIEEDDKVKKVMTKEEVKEKSAKVVSTSLFIYIFSIAFLIVCIFAIKINPIIIGAVSLCMVGLATAIIVRHYMSIPKFEKNEEEKNYEKIIKQIESIIRIICFATYFLVSFFTKVWDITWVTFIIGELICKIVKLVFIIKKKI